VTRIPNLADRVFSWSYDATRREFAVTRYDVPIEYCASGVEARDKANKLEWQFNQESGVAFVEQASGYKRRNRQREEW
jgi:hypothetical protein